jgi:protein-S-isoprenylcysteine O-methyltransferase Ste14
METVSDRIIIACWVIFVGYWLVSAARGKKIAERQSVPSALAHRIPIGLGWWLLIFPRFRPPMNQLVMPHVDMVLLTGALICVLGLLVTIWARRTLAGNWSSDVTFKQGHELVCAGPYRFVRHPIYTGLLIMCVGTGIEVGQLRCWIGTAAVLIGFWIKLSQEERLLLRHFPEAYPDYRKRVKALVPWIL